MTYIWAVTCDFQQCGILTSADSDEPVHPPFKLRNSKWCSVSGLRVIENIQATSKGSDQTAHMCRLVWAFAGGTFHIVEKLILWLIWEFKNSLHTSVFCWLSLQTVWTQIRPDKMSNLIWIPTIWDTDHIPGRSFEKCSFWKKVKRWQKSIQNFRECKELITGMSQQGTTCYSCMGRMKI